MKAFLVLLLVAVAAGGLFFVLRGGESPPENGGATVVRDDDVVRTETRPEDAASALAAVGEGEGRASGVIESELKVVAPAPNDPEFATLGAGSVMGIVVDEKQTPILGAEVTLTRFGSNALFMDVDRSLDVTTVTGSDGTFAFASVPAYESYSLIAKHKDYSPTELPTLIVQDGGMTEVPAIVMRPGVALSGRITDSGGNSVPNAKLTLNQNMFVASLGGDDNADAIEAKTDELGHYIFTNLAPQPNYTLAVVASGYGSVNETVAVIAGEENVKNVVLEVASMLAGVVVSATDGEPILDVTIQAYSMDRSKSRTVVDTKSLETGDFELVDIPPGRYQIVARHPRFQAMTNQQVESGEMQIAIELSPLPVVTGQVVDMSTGAPITKFEAQLRQAVPGAADGMSTAIPQSRLKFDSPDGTFELVVPKAGEFMVEAIAGGFADTYSSPFQTALGADASGVVVRMTRGGTLIGRVLGDSGEPVVGATVSTHDKEWSDDLFWQSLGAGAPGNATETTVRTNADGTFILKNLTPANYQIVVKHREFAQETVKDLVVAEGQESRVGDVLLPRGATVKGQVFGPSGRALPGATVTMFPTTSGARTYTAQTAKNGEYEIKNVREGSYKIHASRPRTNDGNPFVENIDMKNTQKVLSVPNGGTIEGIEFKLTDQ